jgi:hypothetical protein
MSDTARKLGEVIDADDCAFSVGVDRDMVTIWPGIHENPHRQTVMRLSCEQAEEFARLFVRACWEAAGQDGAP